jgi:hypothetical protein
VCVCVCSSVRLSEVQQELQQDLAKVKAMTLLFDERVRAIEASLASQAQTSNRVTNADLHHRLRAIEEFLEVKGVGGRG